MVMHCPFRRGAAIVVVAASVIFTGPPAHAVEALQQHGAAAVQDGSRCRCPAKLSRFGGRLKHVAHPLIHGAPVTIVALGSSSTAGAMASRPDQSYPSRLAAELQAKFPRSAIRVINRGRNGDTTSGMLQRLDSDVLAEKPDLVIWQLGTNSVLRDESLAPMQAQVQSGLSRIRASGADVILIDPQFAPQVTAKPDAHRMVQLISTLASRDHVPLFQRFEIMRSWHDEGTPFSTFLARDDLHHNDWGYGCIARLLARMIAQSVSSEEVLAHHATVDSLSLWHGSAIAP